jgi:nucleoside-diphosphate-sugar epimerase
MDPEEATMNILITGGNGFVGKNLLRKLEPLQWNITILDRNIPDPENRSDSVTFWQGDLLYQTGLKSLAAKSEPFDAIVHLAAMLPGSGDDIQMLRINVDGTNNVIRYFAHPETQIIFLSSGLVYGAYCFQATEESTVAPEHPYAKSKVLAEQCVLDFGDRHGNKTTILRPSVLYGPGAPKVMFIQSMLNALLENQEFPMTAGEQFRDFLHIDDAVEVLSRILRQRIPGVFNVASGEVVSISEVADRVAEISGKRNLIRKGVLPYRENESFQYSLDAKKLRNVLQWKPQVLLENGLADIWNHMNQEVIS